MQQLVRAQDKIGKFETLISTKDGRVAAVEKRRLYEYPFFLCTDPPNNEVDVPAGGTSIDRAMRVSGEGPVQLTQMGALRDNSSSGYVGHGAVTVRLYMRDGSQPIEVSNVPLHIDTIFGSGGNMYPLPEGLYIDETRAMSAVFTNLNPDTATRARIVLVGAKYSQLQNDPSLARVKQRLEAAEFLSAPQWYGINDGKATLTPYQQLSFVVEINGGSNFELHQLSAVSTGDFLINIVDLAKGESIINAPRNGNYPLPASLFFGSGSYPYRFHEPILVFGGQNLLITLVDTSGSSNTVYLTLGGVNLKVRKWS